MDLDDLLKSIREEGEPKKGGAIVPAKFFGEDRYEKYYQELLSEGRIDGDNLSSDERKEGVKAYRKGKVDFEKFVNKVLKVKAEVNKQVETKDTPTRVVATDRMLPGTAVAPDIKPPEEVKEEKKEQKKEQERDDDVEDINKKLDDLLEEIRKEGKAEEKVREKKRKQDEKKKRKEKENKLEGFKKFIVKPLTKAFKPVQNFLQKFFDAIIKVVLAKAFIKLIDWFSDPENSKKIDSIFRFVKDFWPAIAAGFLLVGAALTGFGILALGKIAAVAALLIGLTASLAALAKALFGPGEEEKKTQKALEDDYEGDKDKMIADLEKEKEGLNWFQKNVQGRGAEIDEQIDFLKTGKTKSYGFGDNESEEPNKEPQSKEPNKEPQSKEPNKEPQKMSGGGLVQLLSSGGVVDPRLVSGFIPSLIPPDPRSRYDTSEIDNISVDSRSRYDTSEIDNIPVSGVEKKKQMDQMSLMQRLSGIPIIGQILQKIFQEDQNRFQPFGNRIGSFFGNFFGNRSQSKQQPKQEIVKPQRPLIYGPMGTDTVPAMLTPGEFVMSKGAVDKFGIGTMMEINKAGGGTNRPKVMSGTTYAAGGGFVQPVPKGSYKGNAGQRYGDPRGYGPHAGIDITEDAPWGSDPKIPVVSMKDGTVVQNSPGYPYTTSGYTSNLTVDHGDGILATYLHTKPLKKVGSKVKKSETIGKMIDLGDQTHLHLQMYEKGKQINPLKFVKGAGKTDAIPSTPDTTEIASVAAEAKSISSSSPANRSMTARNLAPSRGSQTTTPNVVPIPTGGGQPSTTPTAGSDVPQLGSVDPQNNTLLIMKSMYNIV